jgi:hypothetical protein
MNDLSIPAFEALLKEKQVEYVKLLNVHPRNSSVWSQILDNEAAQKRIKELLANRKQQT